MEPRIQYAKTRDGVSIAYCIEGRGPPLLLCPLFLESFSLDGVLPEFRQFVRALGKGRTLIRYDCRGMGLSARGAKDLSPEAMALDMEAVVRSAGMPKLDVLAGSALGPRAIIFCAANSDFVKSVILYGSYARVRDVVSADELVALAMLAKSNWTVASQTMADMSGREEFPATLATIAEWFRLAADGDVVYRILEAWKTVDVSGLLSRIGCPTLVLHRTRDSIFPFRAGQALAAGIPGSRLIPLEGTGHHISLGDQRPTLRAIASFLGKRAEPPKRPKRLASAAAEAPPVRTILFTDVEASTALTQRLGDARAREALREHERIVREALAAHGGSEVKTMGDGFMASFGSAAKALECAIAIQQAFAEWNQNVGAQHAALLQIRIGLNAGEPIAEEADLFGTAVILAARIAGQAAGGEILVSNVVRELVAGKGFLFADRGESVLRGFEDPVRLYEARWREPE